MPESNYEIDLLIEAENEQKAEVIRLTAEGRKPAEIQSITGLPAKRQREINQEFAVMARSSDYINRRAKEIVAYADVHFQSIIDRLNEAEEDAKMNGDTKLRADILTRIMNAENARQTFLQKAGIINDAGVGAELAEREAREAQILAILTQAMDRFPEAGAWIKQQIIELNS